MKGLQSKYDRKRKRSSNRATKTTNEIEEKKEDNQKKLEKTQEVDPEVVDLSLNPTQKKVFFVLDNAPLAKIQIKRGVWRVAHSEDDAAAIVRQKKRIDNFRSDIVHEALKGIIDSTLCKNGMVGGIFVETENGVLFQVKPHVRIPRTLPRFCGVMLELLDRSSVRANETNEKLFQVIEKPVTRHIPPNSHIIGISADSKKVVDIESHVSASDNDCNLVFVVGASPHGKINEGYVDNMISAPVSYFGITSQLSWKSGYIYFEVQGRGLFRMYPSSKFLQKITPAKFGKCVGNNVLKRMLTWTYTPNIIKLKLAEDAH